MASDKRVTRSSFADRLERISSPRALPTVPDRIWSTAEWELIQRGYRSHDMDEKWDAFVEGEVLFLHRSWTGLGAFEVTFGAAPGGRRIIRIDKNGALKSSPGPQDEIDLVLVELVVSSIILGEPARELRAELVELMTAGHPSENVPAAALLHSIVGLRSGPLATIDPAG